MITLTLDFGQRVMIYGSFLPIYPHTNPMRPEEQGFFSPLDKETDALKPAQAKFRVKGELGATKEFGDLSSRRPWTIS